jgi:tartrate dehydrogenase/decarboxylase/D-malate dehydrogenase
VIPGDGIGREVIAEGMKALAALERALPGFRVEATEFPWGCEHYLEHGLMMPRGAIETLSAFDAIYLGGVGWPEKVPEELAVRGVVLAIRFAFDEYANVRPIKPLPGAPFPLAGKDPAAVDFVVVREATEGLYCGQGGRYGRGQAGFERWSGLRRHFLESEEIAVQIGLYSEQGCRRVMRYAFELARRRAGKRRVTSCTKVNALNYGMKLWNDVFEEVAAGYPDVENEWMNADALAMRFVTQPERFDVVVAPNLFGDFLTDLAATLVGGLGMAPGGNLAPGGVSMFEPPHGTAPDIAGRGIANPIAALLTAAIMLEELSEPEAAQRLHDAVAQVVRDGAPRTPDIGGTATTQEVGDAVANYLLRR